MIHRGKTRSSAGRPRTLAQRLIAIGLFLLMVVVVADPLWEMHDHLDNIRHLGAHGVLLVLLIVLCSGITLLKSVAIAPPNFSGTLLPGIAADLRRASGIDVSACFASSAAQGMAALPLRI